MRITHASSGPSILLGRFVCQRPVALGVPPQSTKCECESGWRLGRSEGLAEILEGHGAIFSKYADTNDAVLLYANVTSPLENR